MDKKFTNACQICGTENNLNAIWYLDDFNTLCDTHHDEEFRKQSPQKMYEKYFQPDAEINLEISNNYVNALRNIAKAYRQKGIKSGDALCKSLDINLNTKG